MKTKAIVNKILNASKKLDRVLRLIAANEQRSLAANRKKEKSIKQEVKGSLKIQERARQQRNRAWSVYRSESGT